MADSRSHYDQRRGPVFEDEELWETRTRAFLEWFAIEVAGNDGTAVARAIQGEQDPRTRQALLAWSRSYRCLAEVVELRNDKVVLIDLIGGAHIPVDERRGLAGVSTGDIAEIRIVAFEQEIHFGGWFLWHPEGTRAQLLTHLERMRSADMSREEILDFVASLRVRSLRYSHVPAARVYAQLDPPTIPTTAANPTSA